MTAIDTFSEIKTAVGDYLDRSDINSQIDEFIRFGELRIFRECRLRAFETALSSTIASGVIAVPSAYIEMKYAYVDGSPTSSLQRKDLSYIYEKYPTRSADSKPKFYAREGSNFIFGPYPDSGYTIKGIYYGALTALSTDNETNWIATDAPDLLVYAALLEAEPFLGNDERIPVWEAAYNRTKAHIQAQDDQEAFSGSPLAVTAA